MVEIISSLGESGISVPIQFLSSQASGISQLVNKFSGKMKRLNCSIKPYIERVGVVFRKQILSAGGKLVKVILLSSIFL